MLVTKTLPGRLEELIAQALSEVDPNLAVTSVRTMQEQVALTFDQERAVASLAGLFGTVALLLAAVGMYGVTAYMVAQRTREIGIRMALGAKHAKVAQLILGCMSRRVFAGQLLGLPLAVGAGRLISSQLYGISSWDPMALMIAASALAMSACAAGIIPSTRAALISPNGGLANGIADLPRLRLALPSDPVRSLGPGQHGQIVRQAWEPTTQQASRPIQTVAGWEYGLSPGPAAGRPLVMIRAGIPRRSTPGTYVPYCVPRPTQRKGCRIG